VLGEGEIWGWTSTRSLSIGVGGMLLMIIWVLYTLRKKDALINLHQLSARAVIAVNLSAFLICLSMYMFVPLIVEFVQIPKSSGIGFSASILTSGLLLVPLSVTMLISSRFIPLVMRRFSARVVIPLGCTVFGIASLYFAVEHNHLWQAFLASSVAGIGMGFTFAAMPSYIVRSVPEEETGAALGLYQLIQRIGLSIGSAAAGTMLAHFTLNKESYPSLRGFTTIMYVAFVMLILTAIASYFLLGPSGDDVSHTKADQSIFEP
jgi:MFS family permease